MQESAYLLSSIISIKTLLVFDFSFSINILEDKPKKLILPTSEVMPITSESLNNNALAHALMEWQLLFTNIVDSYEISRR